MPHHTLCGSHEDDFVILVQVFQGLNGPRNDGIRSVVTTHGIECNSHRLAVFFLAEFQGNLGIDETTAGAGRVGKLGLATLPANRVVDGRQAVMAATRSGSTLAGLLDW